MGRTHHFADKVSAVSTLRIVVGLEAEYSSAYPCAWFACELPLLRPIGQKPFPDNENDDRLNCRLNGCKSGETTNPSEWEEEARKDPALHFKSFKCTEKLVSVH